MLLIASDLTRPGRTDSPTAPGPAMRIRGRDRSCELLARITVVGKIEVNKVYDPACGSGSLLLKFVKVLGRDKVRLGSFGQEVNLTTYNLCRINMFLHDVSFEKFDIATSPTGTR
jgi:type I restriction enzyme M protein